jgi:hypothetical protein
MRVSETSDLEGNFLEKTAVRRAGISDRFATATRNEALGRRTLSLARGMIGRTPDLPKPMMEVDDARKQIGKSGMSWTTMKRSFGLSDKDGIRRTPLSSSTLLPRQSIDKAPCLAT